MTSAVSRFVDAVLGDLSVRTGMYVGRRGEVSDADPVVIQTGEDGRHRLALPDLGSARSMERFANEAQAHLATVLGAPVPRCPLHEHALSPRAVGAGLDWVCPDGAWRCPLGDYEEATWPQRDASDLAPILVGRVQRRGLAVASVSVKRTGDDLVAEFGLRELAPDLIAALRDAAAPVPASFHREPHTPIRLAAPARP